MPTKRNNMPSSMPRKSRAVMIATLGGKPQVLTFALDLLLAETHGGIASVFALHFSPASDARLAASLQKLQAEFLSHPAYAGIRFESVPIEEHLAERPPRAISESDDRVAAHAIWMTAHRLFTRLRANDMTFELCITGGPRLIATQTLSVATVLFAPHDHCWHLYTPRSLREEAGDGRLMHVTEPAESGTQLVDVPILPVSMLIPGLQAAASQSPEGILAEGKQRIEESQMRQCRRVVANLTQRQGEVLREFARERADVAGVAARLRVSTSTVDSHKRAILAECRNAWDLKDGEYLSHHYLRDQFGRLPDSFWEESKSQGHKNR